MANVFSLKLYIQVGNNNNSYNNTEYYDKCADSEELHVHSAAARASDLLDGADLRHICAEKVQRVQHY